MDKKYVTMGLFLLIFSVSITSYGTPSKTLFSSALTGTCFYVGGNGPGNYSSIQEAINDSSDGDTIYVYDDSAPYFEHLNIFKSISLIGENKKTTIIDGQGCQTIVLIQTTDHVHINGFTIQNSTRPKLEWDSLFGVGIKLLGVSHCTIDDVIIQNTHIGVHLLNYIVSSFTYSNIINQTCFKLTTIAIIMDGGSGYTTITNNTFLCNRYGLLFITPFTNTITKNTFISNIRAALLRPMVFWPEGDPFDELDHNTWSANYWGRPHLIRLFLGRLQVAYEHTSYYYRYLEIEKNPAKKPGILF